MKSDDQLRTIISKYNYQYILSKVCVFFVNHSEESEREKERKKDKQVSFYCTKIINHVFVILINECENKFTLHKTIKASFFSLLVLEKIVVMFIFYQSMTPYHTHKWMRLTTF
jgi:hypothetical protein